ncbi:MAG: hypothetical protein COA86_11985 [Kangiella sp.]|nr:MAG: hypothetical protein COA86_11985 [Kangiella sp.]
MNTRFRFNKFVIASSLIFTGLATNLFAESSSNHNKLSKTITITAARTEKNLNEVSSKVTVISKDDIEKNLVRDIRDLVRYEPGITVSGTGRFGLSGFNIRGISGDRILTLVDGVPVPDEFSFGPALSARRNFVDVDSLKAVEIIRGPASSLYGSNAMGGLVAFVTKDPYDYISSNNTDYYTGIKLSYDSVDSSFDQTFTYAGGNKTLSAMLVLTHRKGNEFKTYFNDSLTGSSRQSANPISNEDLNILTKIVYQPDEKHSYKLTLEKFNSETDSNAQSLVGSRVFGSLRNDVTSEDSRDRARIAFEYNVILENLFADDMHFNFYNQTSDSKQLTFENRTSASGINQIRSRDSLFEQDNLGFKLSLVKDIHAGIEQQIVYGIDYDKNESATLRLGSTINADSGDVIPEFTAFPTRDFPLSKYTSYGIFIQDELSFMQRKLLLIPSIRYDNFKLTAKTDAYFLNGNPGAPAPVGFEESQVSSKLGIIYNLSDSWSVYGQYAEGFKAPSLDAVNTGFTNLAGGYTTLPNPDLEPESSETVEIGFRFKGKIHQFEVSAYKNDYNNFIESLAFKGFNPATFLVEFQAINLDKTTIEGYEVKGFWDMKDIAKGLHLQYALSTSKGEDKTTHLPLNSIQADSIVIGLGYDSADNQWGADIILTANDDKTDIDDSAIQPRDPNDPAVPAFNTPGYLILGWVGRYNISENIRVNWGIFNLTDKQYWNWNDVGLRTTTSSALPRLTKPGRNASISIKMSF